MKDTLIDFNYDYQDLMEAIELTENSLYDYFENCEFQEKDFKSQFPKDIKNFLEKLGRIRKELKLPKSIKEVIASEQEHQDHMSDLADANSY